MDIKDKITEHVKQGIHYSQVWLSEAKNDREKAQAETALWTYRGVLAFIYEMTNDQARIYRYI